MKLKLKTCAVAGVACFSVAVATGVAHGNTNIYENNPPSGFAYSGSQTPWLGDRNMNDKASSGYVYVSCKRYYNDINYGGTYLTLCPRSNIYVFSQYTAGQPFPLTWNDKITSLRPA